MLCLVVICVFFFFQAEDGIRDLTVTGVQTCALPISLLAYFRSQHSNQSWLAALTTVLDASALVMVAAEGACARQAGLTFAMARHAVVDLAQVFRTRPRPPPEDRLPAPVLAKLTADLAAAGCPLLAGAAAGGRLAELRRAYEPYAAALSSYLLQPLPPRHQEKTGRDNWQSGAWDRTLLARITAGREGSGKGGRRYPRAARRVRSVSHCRTLLRQGSKDDAHRHTSRKAMATAASASARSNSSE